MDGNTARLVLTVSKGERWGFELKDQKTEGVVRLTVVEAQHLRSCLDEGIKFLQPEYVRRFDLGTGEEITAQ